MSYPDQKDLTVFEIGILATLNTIVGSLKNSGSINAGELEEVHKHLAAGLPREAKGPIDAAMWSAAIAPLLAKLEVTRD